MRPKSRQSSRAASPKFSLVFQERIYPLQWAFIGGLFFGLTALSMPGLMAYNCHCRRFLVRARQKTCIERTRYNITH
jgi:hypothetical protein